MAHSALQKLLRHQTQSAAKIISHFNKPCTSSPHPLVLTQIAKSLDQTPFPSPPESDYPSSSRSSSSLHVYPSFSLGFFLNPISPPLDSNIRPGPDEEMPPDDSRTIRADSVKKKRKKKMNKHKLRKLRRRLRRKTKT